MIETLLLPATPDGIAAAADLLAEGALVALPTETVYGLAADAANATAVARIFAAKGRPRFNPLIVHVPSLDAARELAHFDARAETLAAAFWPGPLTLVLPLRKDAALCPLVTAGLGSVALRVPAHPVAQAVLRASGRPLAAPSANPSGKISPTKAAHVMAGLAGQIEAVLDGGTCGVGLESTIVGLVDTPTLLRPGGLPADAIQAVLGQPLAAPTDQITAPGQLASHYAPNAPLRLNATTRQANEFLIGFGGTPGADIDLSPTANLTQAAAQLFSALHLANDTGQPIAVAPIPNHALGRAINDRLARAAAPRG